jgi:hypothetical protein
MALGAYSVVRYSDNFRDERVNVGVVVWHPNSGFEWKFVPTLERIKAINPSVKPMAVRKQIRMVEDRLREAGNGKETLDELSSWLKDGLEFCKPNPARMTAASETTTRLYDMLVPPPGEHQSREIDFDSRMESTLQEELMRIAPQSRMETIGERWVAGVKVNVGLHTHVRNSDLLWRTVSMRARAHADQIARAKSAVMDILKIRGIAEYANYQHVVAIDSPTRFGGEGLAESKRWIEDAGAGVLEINNQDQMTDAINQRLAAA